ncbi:hypothetical protein PV328_004183 [Microctonus aethiopoides]|uniref:BEN domain-containing protein n=1 Tax=Microctonus aethiopoides TaxID=144406 RepID=A0AA39KLA3_9HYME|nr:hypothetical protein PV328_004183 [Microctonus aethiopoides]
MNNVEQHYSYQQFPPVALQSSTEKNGVALSRTPLSLIIYDAQNPIMEQPHNATMSSCVIDEKQKTQAVFDGKNRYELVSNNDHEIVPSLCDESSSSVSSSDEDQFQITVQQVRAMAATLPGKVSKKALMYQTLLTAAMRYQFETENCRRGKPTKSTFEIPDWYSQPGPNREAISSHSRFYMDKNKIAYLNEISTINGTVDWKVLTREVLVDVYGSALGNYCATGKRGKKPPINRELLKGLHEWINRTQKNNAIPKTEFIRYICKTISNKRKYGKQKINQKNKC